MFFQSKPKHVEGEDHLDQANLKPALRCIVLTEQELLEVGGGTADKSSPNLALACANGKHFVSATVTVR